MLPTDEKTKLEMSYRCDLVFCNNNYSKRSVSKATGIVHQASTSLICDLFIITISGNFYLHCCINNDSKI